MNEPNEQRAGLLYGLTAYTLWGMMPLYFTQLAHVWPLETLSHRVLWSALLLLVVMLAFGRGSLLVAALSQPRTRNLLMASTLLIGINWFVYIYSVATRQALHSSLGYYVLPLFNVLLGLVLFGERMRPWQWFALALAGIGLVFAFYQLGQIPWITITLAVSFGFYGLLRKIAPVDALTGLTAETVLLAPLALILLVTLWCLGSLDFARTDGGSMALLMLTGVVTTIPLLCFGKAARRLPLTVLGLIQYVSPSLQFVFAVTVLGEELRPELRLCFACTWAALVIFTIEGLVHRTRATEPIPPVES